jgi:hypothetical protein
LRPASRHSHGRPKHGSKRRHSPYRTELTIGEPDFNADASLQFCAGALQLECAPSFLGGSIYRWRRWSEMLLIDCWPPRDRNLPPTPMSSQKLNLTKNEVARAVDGVPPILSPGQLASVLGLSIKTVYLWIADGRLDGAFRRRGKHLLIWRDRAIDQIFNGPNWSNKE